MPKASLNENADKSARSVVTSGFSQWVLGATKRTKARLRPAISPFGAVNGMSDHRPAHESRQIHERSGIWVVTIGGIWRGDYTKREHAVAAAASARFR